MTDAPNIVPPAAAWISLLLSLFIAITAVSYLLPVKARLPGRQRLWEPELDRIPLFLRWLIKILAAVVNWLKVNWPRLLNSLIGSSLIIVGGQLLLLAWSLSRTQVWAVRRTMDLGGSLFWVPLEEITDLFQRPGGIITSALFGALILITGIGLLARFRLARLFTLGTMAALFGGSILLWPSLILAPVVLPFQLEMVMVLGVGAIILLATLIRCLIHPQFRRYYMRMTDGL